MEEKILQDIAEAKSCLKKEIEEKEELLRFIETLDLSKPVNREEWVKICSTALKEQYFSCLCEKYFSGSRKHKNTL